MSIDATKLELEKLQGDMVTRSRKKLKNSKNGLDKKNNRLKRRLSAVKKSKKVPFIYYVSTFIAKT